MNEFLIDPLAKEMNMATVIEHTVLCLPRYTTVESQTMILNKMGKESWEVCAVVPTNDELHFYLKRKNQVSATRKSGSSSVNAHHADTPFIFNKDELKNLSTREIVLRLRSMQGLTLVALQNRSGVSFSAIQKIEKGAVKRPNTRTLMRIAKGLGVTLEDLQPS